ncbi:MAG: zinc ABC transporter substrate-binding protein [Treponema sp.]|jgi:zinc transport system substrate-binding protein|nr:zinc ABC transporter substrate-binding protein [Treponema sp.]
MTNSRIGRISREAAFRLFWLAFVSCSGKAEDGKPVVAVSILPQAWFVEQIAGDNVEVVPLAGPGQNLHTFEPSPRRLSELARADVWLLSGAEFELSLKPKIQNNFKNLVIIDTTEGVVFRSLAPNEMDGDEDVDRHSWLGREPAKTAIRYIKNSLCALDSNNAEKYQNNYENLCAEIDAEFERLHRRLASLEGTSVFVYHPAFGYFLDEFGVLQEAIEEGGKEPTMRSLFRLVEKAREARPRAVFVQAQFPIAAAKTVARSIDAEVVPLDPLAENWLENIRHMGEMLGESVVNREL